MKPASRLLVLVMTVLTLRAGVASAQMGGDGRIALDPASAPVDTLAVFRIAQPGSYYLKGTVHVPAGKHGVVIVAADVTLDLNGFSISGAEGSLNGVEAFGVDGLSVKNGSISGCAVGVEAAASTGAVVERVRLRRNRLSGVQIGSGIVEGCTVESSGLDGVRVGSGSIVKGCVVRASGGTGISAAGPGVEVSGCVAAYNAVHGVALDDAGRVEGCTAARNGQDGIFVFGRGLVRESVAADNGAIGIACVGDCDVRGNLTGDHPYAGIYAQSRCRVQGNYVQSRWDGSYARPSFGVVLAQGGNHAEGNWITGGRACLQSGGTPLTPNSIVGNYAASGGYEVDATVDVVGPAADRNNVYFASPWFNFNFR